MVRRNIESEQNYEIEIEEIEMYLKKLKNMKAVGPDGIPNEFYKEGGNIILKGLDLIFKQIESEEEIPITWNVVNTKVTYKGGKKDKKEIKNYRPIAVANTVANIYCGLIKEKIRDILETEEIISEEQNGFRKDRRGTENLYIIKEIIDEVKKDNKEIYCAFLDIEKAYDTVDRQRLWEILERIGLSEHIRKIIKSMYRNTEANYDWNGVEIKEVKSTRGLRQGCTLSPLLFTLVMEELTQRIRNKKNVGIKIGEERLNILLFADDVVLIAEDREGLQELLDEVSIFSVDMNMKFGVDKCKVMKINGKQNNMNCDKFNILGKELEIVDEIKYLGLIINKDGMENEKNRIRNKAEKMYGIINGKTNCRINKYEIIRGLWKGMTMPTIMYRLEVIAWGKKEIKRIEVVKNKACS